MPIKVRTKKADDNNTKAAAHYIGQRTKNESPASFPAANSENVAPQRFQAIIQNKKPKEGVGASNHTSQNAAKHDLTPVPHQKVNVIQRDWSGEPLHITGVAWDHVVTEHGFATGNNNKSRWGNVSQDQILKWIVAAFNQAKAYIKDDDRKTQNKYLYGDAGEIVGTGSDGKQTQRVDMFVNIGGLGDGDCYVATAYPKTV